MIKKKKKRPQRLPVSGNPLVDWMFRRLVYFLKRRVDEIKKSKKLRNPNDRRRIMYGYLEVDREFSHRLARAVIFLRKSDDDTHDDLGQYLVHELSHFICPLVGEEDIYRLEKILWQLFTLEQKKIIRSYIPKHTIEKDPLEAAQ